MFMAVPRQVCSIRRAETNHVSPPINIGDLSLAAPVPAPLNINIAAPAPEPVNLKVAAPAPHPWLKV